MITSYRYLLALLSFVLVLVATWYIGYTKGKQNAEKQYLTQQINQLQTVIINTKTQTKQAQEASAKFEQLVSAKTEVDLKTTKDFYNALKTTKTIRTQCVFDDRIMQQLDNARRRAASATYSSQADGVLPSSRGDER